MNFSDVNKNSNLASKRCRNPTLLPLLNSNTEKFLNFESYYILHYENKMSSTNMAVRFSHFCQNRVQ